MRIGDIVKVYNQTPSGKTILEGEAKLQARWAGSNDSSDGKHEYWEVKFLSDGSVVDRWIKKATTPDKNKEALDSFFAKNI